MGLPRLSAPPHALGAPTAELHTLLTTSGAFYSWRAADRIFITSLLTWLACRGFWEELAGYTGPDPLEVWLRCRQLLAATSLAPSAVPLLAHSAARA